MKNNNIFAGRILLNSNRVLIGLWLYSRQITQVLIFNALMTKIKIIKPDKNMSISKSILFNSFSHLMKTQSS